METKQKKLTRKQAIQICKELWTNVFNSGGSKFNYLDTHPEFNCHGGIWDCPLCKWTSEGNKLASNKNKSVYKDTTNHNSNGSFPFLHCANSQRICPLIHQYKKNCFQLGFNRQGNQDWLKAVLDLKEE